MINQNNKIVDSAGKQNIGQLANKALLRKKLFYISCYAMWKLLGRRKQSLYENTYSFLTVNTIVHNIGMHYAINSNMLEQT